MSGDTAPKKRLTFRDKIMTTDRGIQILVEGRWFHIGDDSTSDRPRRDKYLLECFVADIIKRQKQKKDPR